MYRRIFTNSLSVLLGQSGWEVWRKRTSHPGSPPRWVALSRMGQTVVGPCVSFGIKSPPPGPDRPIPDPENGHHWPIPDPEIAEK